MDQKPRSLVLRLLDRALGALQSIVGKLLTLALWVRMRYLLWQNRRLKKRLMERDGP